MTDPRTLFDTGATLLGIVFTIWLVGPMTLTCIAAFAVGYYGMAGIAFIAESIYDWYREE
jgi:hypothetical protein